MESVANIDNLQKAWFVVVHSDYELQTMMAFKKREDAEKFALKMGNFHYCHDDCKFETVYEMRDYEKSEEWWDNDDRTTIEIEFLPIHIQYI